MMQDGIPGSAQDTQLWPQRQDLSPSRVVCPKRNQNFISDPLILQGGRENSDQRRGMVKATLDSYSQSWP